MVDAIRGLFILCDAPMAEFIAMLNESMPEFEKFIVDRLDDTHMYLLPLPHVADMIRHRIAEFRNCNSSNYRPRKQRN